MNGNGVSRAHGPGLNGAGDFYYEAVEGAQSPGDLLLSPAAFINPAQYASVLEGRFKQLQGEGPGRWAPGRRIGAEHAERDAVRARPYSAVCVGRQCPARGIITRGQGNTWVLAESGKAWGPWKKGQRGGSARVSTPGGAEARRVWRGSTCCDSC